MSKTPTRTTYRRVRMDGANPTNTHGPECDSLAVANESEISGIHNEHTAIQRVDWRLGADGMWRETGTVIVALHGEVR